MCPIGRQETKSANLFVRSPPTPIIASFRQKNVQQACGEARSRFPSSGGDGDLVSRLHHSATLFLRVQEIHTTAGSGNSYNSRFTFPSFGPPLGSPSCTFSGRFSSSRFFASKETYTLFSSLPLSASVSLSLSVSLSPSLCLCLSFPSLSHPFCLCLSLPSSLSHPFGPGEQISWRSKRAPAAVVVPGRNMTGMATDPQVLAIFNRLRDQSSSLGSSSTKSNYDLWEQAQKEHLLASYTNANINDDSVRLTRAKRARQKN